MKFLLDTHALLWLIDNDPRVSATVISLYLNTDNQRYFSTASIWEIAIKVSIGKLKIKDTLERFVDEHIWRNAIDILPIKTTHLYQIPNLQHYHRDPFDRLLISQCLDEKIPILSADTILDKYGVRRIW